MKKDNFWKGFLGGLLTMVACLLLFVVITTYTGKINWSVLIPSASGSVVTSKVQRKIDEIQAFIAAHYLDDIDAKEMEDSICRGVVDGLGDTYAAYYNEEDFANMQEKTSGNYCGIGAYVSQDATTGAITIIKPMEDSPAARAGIKAGDEILQIDGESISGQDLSAVVSKMKGKEGTKVTLAVKRSGEPKSVEMTVTREQIETITVASKMLDGDIGYVVVSSFEGVTKSQFQKAVDKLEKKGMKFLIIDLRDNGGGLVDTAVDMLDRLLPQELVLYTLDKDGTKTEYFATDEESLELPIAILVNGNSASASEVFSGAMQDYGRAVLIGTTTFGKGIVQSVYTLSDGTALKLTTAKYYTPKGRNIHETGLKPDVEVELNEKTTELPKTGLTVDNQIKAAMDYLKKKK